MGLWSGIKYALNSSLGMPEFKPLDTMIGEVKEQAEEIKSTNLIKYASAVKSVQRGTATMNASPFNVTISAVDMNKTNVNFLGFAISSNSAAGFGELRYMFPRIQLTGSTTLSIYVNGYQAGFGPTVSWEVVEYY